MKFIWNRYSIFGNCFKKEISDKYIIFKTIQNIEENINEDIINLEIESEENRSTIYDIQEKIQNISNNYKKNLPIRDDLNTLFEDEHNTLLMIYNDTNIQDQIKINTGIESYVYYGIEIN